jgi:hypothetical protein
MRRIAVVAVVSMFAFVACTDETPTEPVATPTTDAAADAAEPAEPEPSAEPEEAYLTYVTGIRHQPTEAKKVEIEGKTKKQYNWMSTLYRGEELTVVEIEGEWAKVKASDDTEGWLKKTGLLPVDGVSLATVFDKTKTFYRPDLLAQNTSRMIDPATLLFVLKTKDQFTEVNYYGQGKAWVLSDKLTADPMEISAAKLLAKVQYLKQKKDKDAGMVLELARSQFGESKLVGMANDEGKVQTEEEKAAAEAAPAAAAEPVEEKKDEEEAPTEAATE